MTVTASSLSLSERARVLKPSSTLGVTARVLALKAAGRDIIGFGAGEPDFDTAEPIKQVAIDALRAGQTRYVPVPGPKPVRTAIADKLTGENAIRCTADDIVITVGAKHAIFLTLQALVDPGQEVILPTPAWVSYAAMIGLCGGITVEVAGRVDNDFKITPAQLEEAISPSTKALILNSPSNPCGTMYTRDELTALMEIVARHDRIVIISDEIYEKLVYGTIEHCSPGSFDSVAERVVTVNGLSKAYAMTGWRLGYACAPGRAGAGSIASAIARLQGQMTTHTVAFGYPAIVDALTNRADVVESMRRTFAERAVLIHGELEAMEDVVCPKPTGAFYVFPDVGAYFGRTSPDGRVIDSSVSFAEALLEEAGVAVVPGQDFGACASRHVRLSFACSREEIEEGCRRMAAWLSRVR